MLGAIHQLKVHYRAILRDYLPRRPARLGVTDSAITEFGIKRQKCKSGISYNAFSANPESPIMETVIKESPIITYLAKQESPIMETAIKESPIMSYSTNSESPIMEVQIALFL
jgi:hypothetical protein